MVLYTKPVNRWSWSVLLGSALIMSACSGSTEDVREVLCKRLAMTLLPIDKDTAWKDSEQRIKGPEYAVIAVRPEGGGEARCWFEYDAVEETAESHVDPLSAYATLPYQMTLNGRQVDDRILLQAVNAERIRQGRAAIEPLRHATHRSSGRAKLLP